MSWLPVKQASQASMKEQCLQLGMVQVKWMNPRQDSKEDLEGPLQPTDRNYPLLLIQRLFEVGYPGQLLEYNITVKYPVVLLQEQRCRVEGFSKAIRQDPSRVICILLNAMLIAVDCWCRVRVLPARLRMVQEKAPEVMWATTAQYAEIESWYIDMLLISDSSTGLRSYELIFAQVPPEQRQSSRTVVVPKLPCKQQMPSSLMPLEIQLPEAPVVTTVSN